MNMTMVDDEELDQSSPNVPFPDTLPPEPVETANQSELARRYKISRNSVIERLKEAGIEPVDIGGKRGTRYEVTDLLDEVLKEDGRVGPTSNRKVLAQERIAEADATLKELNVAKKQEEVVNIMEVELAIVTLFRAIYLRHVLYADDSALAISRMTTRGEVAAYQKKHLATMLLELRNDPNNFVTRNIEPSTELT